MEEDKLKGIILKAIPYQDHHHIVSAFTGEKGIVRLFVRGTKRIRRTSHAICTPLVLAELLFRTKASGLYTLRDGHILDPFSALRNDYQRLDAAGRMAQSLLNTLFPGKPSPQLFTLFVRYLKATETHPFPQTLLTSFLCKLFKAEGEWIAPSLCTLCREKLESAVIVRGEAYCLKCSPDEGINLSEKERKQVAALTDARRLEEMEASPTLTEKVKLLFG